MSEKNNIDVGASDLLGLTLEIGTRLKSKSLDPEVLHWYLNKLNSEQRKMLREVEDIDAILHPDFRFITQFTLHAPKNYIHRSYIEQFFLEHEGIETYLFSDERCDDEEMTRSDKILARLFRVREFMSLDNLYAFVKRQNGCYLGGRGLALLFAQRSAEIPKEEKKYLGSPITTFISLGKQRNKATRINTVSIHNVHKQFSNFPLDEIWGNIVCIDKPCIVVFKKLKN